MNNITSPRKTEPHHRLSRQDVIRDYKSGLLTIRGAIFYLVASARKLGQAVRVSISWVCQQLEISRSSYYRAIGELSEQDRLKISASDEMELTIPTSNTENVPDYIFLNELSQIWDRDSQICDSDSQICDSDSQICDKKTPELAQSNGSGSPQSIQSLQSLSLAKNDGERETAANAQKPIDPAYRDWLIKKAQRLPNPPALIEQWIRKQAPLEANQYEYSQQQDRRVETKFSAAPPPPQISESEIRLSQLTTLNRMMGRGERDRVEQILASRDLGFVIQGDRVVEGES